MSSVLPTADADAAPVQRVVKIRRDYNSWVARESMEDYALRFTARSFRKWSPLRVANTALGGAASFLILEAIGATLLVRYGFTNAALAILATGLVILLAGLPISVYAARHGVDMDLLTRGAGFGYIGSTITSLIYASFTFIFFALEAAVMAYALELAFGVPPAWGYLLCALVVIPLVTHGVTAIGRLQAWTMPLWALLLVAPYVAVLQADPGLVTALTSYAGAAGHHGGFDWLAFGAATTVGIALITQMGEQADYLRFMPERTVANRARGNLAVLIGGPGWVLPGVLKMLGGALLAYLAITLSVPVDRAVDPNQMYLAAYEMVFSQAGVAVAATALLVVISQLKINVTNAYAGSLAWSNFFSRLTHSHPGRVVWVVFNTLIALLLMELNVFSAMGEVLGLYANVAIAWMMAVVADLVVSKPLGWSPPGIEYRRAHLYDVNPVGVGAMGIASLLSVAAHLGAFGAAAQAFSAAIALVTAFVAAPLLAWWTQGRYYLARHDAPAPDADDAPLRLQRCCICEREYEGEDMARCPAYGGPICSLCCTLDARCGDLCKPPEARLATQWSAALRRLLPRAAWPQLDTGLAHYLLLMLIVLPVLAAMTALLERHGFGIAFAVMLLVAGVVCWWLVLAHKSRLVAQEESNRQTHLLVREIESHRRTDAQLQQARIAAERANQAKSRYITAISHELRTPLNSILGYAQLLEEDDAMPPHRAQAVRVIRRGGDHLLGLIEGTLDLARIEAGRLALEPRPMRFADCLQEIAGMMQLQAGAKGLVFETDFAARLPEVVRADEPRLRQILLNVLGNAVKFTVRGRVVFRCAYARETARFEIEDSGPGMGEDELARVFEPFQRGSAAGASSSGGSGLGLTIARMLTDLMGGEMTVASTPGQGTRFSIRLFLPELRGAVVPAARPRGVRRGYAGARRRRVLAVDNEEADRGLLVHLLQPLGFELQLAASGEEALALLQAGAEVDAILIDLAMPGIDGWETIRRVREQGLAVGVPVAVVSANAFDKTLPNDVGITAADFIVKPVRLHELLDWLGARLGLQWIEEAVASPPAASVGDPDVLPAPEALRALAGLVRIGYMRGIVAELDRIEAAEPRSAAFVARARALAREFRLDALAATLDVALEPRHDDAAAPAA